MLVDWCALAGLAMVLRFCVLISILLALDVYNNAVFKLTCQAQWKP